MKNRVTKGQAAVGSLAIGGTSLTATPAEINALADLDVAGATSKTVVISISSTPTGAEQDTGIDLPAKAIITNVALNVTTAEATGATKTMHVGLLSSESGGDADGFLVSASCATTGVKIPSLVSGSVTRGALIKETVTGSGSATHSSPIPFSAGSVTAKSISYTAGSNDWANFRGSILITYTEVN